jgi:hypothetical protein
MPDIPLTPGHLQTMDDLLKLIHVTIDKWPLESRAVFFLRFTKEFRGPMEEGMRLLKANMGQGSGKGTLSPD